MTTLSNRPTDIMPQNVDFVNPHAFNGHREPIAQQEIIPGMRRGHLTILNVHLEPWWLDHGEEYGVKGHSMPKPRSIEQIRYECNTEWFWRDECKSPRCIRCSPETATPYYWGYCIAQCDCGKIGEVPSFTVANGQRARCGYSGWFRTPPRKTDVSVAA